eukprot:scaffold33069_cov68-Phaeocystis_antarctica.AAC.2
MLRLDVALRCGERRVWNWVRGDNMPASSESDDDPGGAAWGARCSSGSMLFRLVPAHPHCEENSKWRCIIKEPEP